jgi:hypothetical protein
MTPQDAIRSMTGDDHYDKSITYAAQQLLENLQLCKTADCACPAYDKYVYYTQYESGATIWRSQNGERSVLVTNNGEIRDSLPHHP